MLREITMNDVNAVFAFRSNKEAMQYISRPVAKTVDDAAELIQRILTGIRDNDGITWGITLKGDNRIIGTIGFWRIEKDHYRTEIGYMLHPDYWGKGIISEAMETVLDYGFNELKFHSVEAHVVPENIPSSKVLEKAGFIREAYFKENFFFEGKFSDTAVYSKLNLKG